MTTIDPSEACAAVAPLVRTNKEGELLRRPEPIEAEIARALSWDDSEILRRAALRDPEDESYMSSECMVHLIRQNLRQPLGEDLATELLRRCAAELRGSVRGFSGTLADDVREEILGRLAVALAEPDGAADFYEVRFALALKRLRIDVCRQARRRESVLVSLDDAAGDDAQGDPMDRLEARLDRGALARPLSPEDLVGLKEALAALGDEERKIFVLYRLAGVSINSRTLGAASLVELTGLSERTVRNRLRQAEAKLKALVEEKR